MHEEDELWIDVHTFPGSKHTGPHFRAILKAFILPLIRGKKKIMTSRQIVEYINKFTPYPYYIKPGEVNQKVTKGFKELMINENLLYVTSSRGFWIPDSLAEIEDYEENLIHRQKGIGQKLFKLRRLKEQFTSQNLF